MNTDTIIRRLTELGVSIQINGDRIQLRPGSSVPDDLQVEIRRNKTDLLASLISSQMGEPESVEIILKVREQGYVLLWSNILQDTVAFVNSWEAALRVPSGFTVYEVGELKTLFGDSEPSEASLRRIHQVKKHGGRIIDD